MNRRDNLKRSADELRVQLEDAKGALGEAFEEMKKVELLDERDQMREREEVSRARTGRARCHRPDARHRTRLTFTDFRGTLAPPASSFGAPSARQSGDSRPGNCDRLEPSATKTGEGFSPCGGRVAFPMPLIMVNRGTGGDACAGHNPVGVT